MAEPKSYDKYFARHKSDDIGQVLVSKVQEYNRAFQSHQFYNNVWMSYRLYYGIDHERDCGTKGLGEGGQKGELSRVKVNRYRTNAQHLISLLTQQRPAFDCRAINNDPESLVQASLGNRILEYVIKNKNYSEYRRKVVEYSLAMAEGYLALDWDDDGGEDYAIEEIEETVGERIRKTGDVTFRDISPFEIVRDTNRYRNEQDWYIFTYKQNKYDLSVKWAGGRGKKKKMLRDVIENTGSKDSLLDYTNSIYSFYDETDSDWINVYEFRHDKTPCMPYGRLVKFLADGTVLADVDLPFENKYIFKIAPAHQYGTAFGYTPMFDIMGIQQGHDRLQASILSNNLTFALQNIRVDSNANVQQQSLPGGLRFLRVAPDAKIEPLKLLNTPAEAYNLLDRQKADMEEGVGVNEAMKGQNPTGVTSGSQLAYLGQAGIQFLSELDNSKIRFEEQVMTAIIQMYKTFGDTPRTLTLIGRSKKSYQKQFTKDDLVNIHRVVVESGNPLSKVLAGRLQKAELYLQMGILKTPDDYDEVVETGTLDQALDGVQKKNLLIADENDKLLHGDPVTVILTDDHPRHIREHNALLSDYDVRHNPQLAGAIMAHIMDHDNKWKQLVTERPELAALLEDPAAQPPPPLGAAGGIPGQQPGNPEVLQANPAIQLDGGGQIGQPKIPAPAPPAGPPPQIGGPPPQIGGPPL